MTGPATRASSIDDVMERASESLTAGRYFECERLCLDAMHRAHAGRDYERMARITLPLLEARRQKRLAAADEGVIHEVLEREEEPTIEAGCWLVAPPLVGADARRVRDLADEQEIPVLAIAIEPLTRDGRLPVVMIGPVTVRTKMAPPEEITVEWMLQASEALGDTALAELDPTAPAARRVDRLLDLLGTLPEHEGVHQALIEACEAAMREPEPTRRR